MEEKLGRRWRGEEAGVKEMRQGREGEKKRGGGRGWKEETKMEHIGERRKRR